jgi:hypothetical protein
MIKNDLIDNIILSLYYSSLTIIEFILYVSNDLSNWFELNFQLRDLLIDT